MKKFSCVRQFLVLALALGILLSSVGAQASEVVISSMRARAGAPRVHSSTHAATWARRLLIFMGGAAYNTRFYVDADPQMFQLLMTAIQMDANIMVKYESTTWMVTSIDIL